MPALLKLAVVVALCGAVLLAVGPLAGVVPGTSPAYGSTAFLVVLAVLPVAVAIGLLAAGRAIGAAGVLAGAGLLGLGRALGDLQLVVGPLTASRPELLAVTSLAPLTAGIGTWLLVAGDVLTLVAGLLVANRAGAQPGSEVFAEFEEDGGQRRLLLGGGLTFGGLATLGLLMPAFRSDNAFLLTPDLMNGPGMAGAGGLLVAVAALLGCVYAGTSRSPRFGRGVLLGVGLAVLTVLLPSQIAGAEVAWLHTDGRSYMATVGAIGLIGTSVWPAGYVPWRRRERAADRGTDPYPMHAVAGVLAVVAGATGLIARASALYVVVEPTDKPITPTDAAILLSGEHPESFANRLLLPASLLLVVLGVLVLVKPIAGAVRPALSVGWVAVPFAALTALDAVITATATSTAISAASGAVWAVVSLFFAIAAAVFAGVAGGIERDTVERTERPANIVLAAPIAGAVLFAVGAFGLPAMRAKDYVAPGIWQNLQLASWGLGLALLGVVVAAVVAARARPGRAAVLLFGAAAVVGVRALEYPLTSGRAADSAAAAGTWLSIACVAALVISAFVALAVKPERR
ncbi:hypothetical protein GCM10029964_113840 [Kibdelosporangium lantanae]